VQYVFVYPEQGEIVLAGPADAWEKDAQGRTIGRTSRRPVLQLDDLVVALRACFAESENHGLFGCGIYPRPARLQQVQEFLAASAARGPLDPSQRDRWLAELRDQLGAQDIEVFGIPAGSRIAHVMIEADYRMKLIGIGLEPAAVPGIPSYFDLLGNPDRERLTRGLDTLRWWFALKYDAVFTTTEFDAFELRGQRVQVLSENELLTATGHRVHTGWSDPVNEQFAHNFTEQFTALADRDTNFADLANVFDLAVVGALLRGHALPQRAGWAMDCFLDPDEYLAVQFPAPAAVETVLNHRVYRGRHILAAISGGVHVNPWKVAGKDRVVTESSGVLGEKRDDSKIPALADSRWWWD
jgi:hypothetical protein